ncbi:MAG TPA: ABATE domain-containing protein, partial [Gaiellaceae bacterium]
DFVATLGDRPKRRIERLGTADDLSLWLSEAGICGAVSVSDEQLVEARALREAIYRVFEGALNGGRVPTRQAALVNEWARRPTFSPQIGPSFARATAGADIVSAALAQLAQNSVELVTGPDLARVRKCAGCSLLFVDRSRPGRRRWCSMDRCGTREKMARYRKKPPDQSS